MQEELYGRDGEYLVCTTCHARTRHGSCHHETGCKSVLGMAFLTQQQREVALWAARGKSRSWIAEYLGIATKTVSNHLHHAYRRLNVGSITQLVHRMYELGVFETEPVSEMSPELAAARPLQPDPTGGRNFGRTPRTQ